MISNPLSNLIIPPPVRLALKLAPYIVIAILAVIVVIRGKEIEAKQAKLHSEISWRQSVAKGIGCPRDGFVAVRQCIDAKMLESENRRVALEQISREALQHKQRADQLDKQLSERQLKNEKLYSKAKPKIDELENRKPGGGTIEEDSKAPWKGWSLKLDEASPNKLALIDPSQWTGATHYKQLVVVAFYPYESWAALREEYKRRGNFTEANLHKKHVGGFSQFNTKNQCEIHVVNPRYTLTRNWVLGHELMHCIYGGWHA